MKGPFLLLLALCTSYSAFCQNVGIGINTPKNKLHIAGGLRVDTLANGLDSGILRHDKNGVVYSLKFTGNANDVLKGNGSFGPGGGSSSGWSLTGNSGTNPASNFIGTIDDQPLMFKINNKSSGVIDRIKANTVIGFSSLPNNNGQKNSVFGYEAMLLNTTGDWNTANGYWALRSNSIGKFNTALGVGTLWYNSIGNANTAAGENALGSNTEGTGNTAHGRDALISNTTGEFNTGIGFGADVSIGTLSNATALGANARVDCSNCLVLGSVYGVNGATSTVNVGIGITDPKSKLHTAGSVRFDTLANNIDSGILRHNKNGLVYSLRFTGNLSDVLRGNGTFGPGGGAASGWQLTGNAGSNPATNFIGTTDAQPLRFRVNSQLAGSLDPFQNNTSFGLLALYGVNNSPVQYQYALNNTAIGSKALYSNGNTVNNTATGSKALYLNTSGYNNTAFGSSALETISIGSSNTALGDHADVLYGDLTNATAIGANAKVGSSNSLVLGGMDASAVNVGIGVASPVVTLHVKGTANFFSGANTHAGAFYAGTSSVDGIEMVSEGTDAWASIQRTYSYGLHITKKNVATNNDLVAFRVNGTLVGNITTDGAGAFFNSTSDARLKENIHPTQFGLDNLMKILVADYNYKSDTKKNLQTGFIAQDLYKLYPQAVQTGGENEKANPWMIDYSKITPLLVRSIQQQQQIMETQKNEIDILKTQVAELIEAVKTLKNK